MTHRTTALFLLAGLLAAQGSWAQDLEHGKAVYDSRCVICHGDQGDGRGLIGIVHRAQDVAEVGHAPPLFALPDERGEVHGLADMLGRPIIL